MPDSPGRWLKPLTALEKGINTNFSIHIQE